MGGRKIRVRAANTTRPCRLDLTTPPYLSSVPEPLRYDVGRGEKIRVTHGDCVFRSIPISLYPWTTLGIALVSYLSLTRLADLCTIVPAGLPAGVRSPFCHWGSLGAVGCERYLSGKSYLVATHKRQTGSSLLYSLFTCCTIPHGIVERRAEPPMDSYI